eukprot:XP_011618784.1 PREDICTED: leucine-rich repeat-containing protein 34-like [Takifugu rubripes]
MLAMNSSLLELHLGMAGMTDTGMERLAEGLAANRALRYLDLRCNRLSCDGASHLAGVLKQNATLDVIDLSFNRIQNGGAVHMSEALASPGCGLRALSVSSNSIGTDGLLSLAQAVKANRTLTDINIWGNDLEEPVCQVTRGSNASRLCSGHFGSILTRSLSGFPAADPQRAAAARQDGRHAV